MSGLGDRRAHGPLGRAWAGKPVGVSNVINTIVVEAPQPLFEISRSPRHCAGRKYQGNSAAGSNGIKRNAKRVSNQRRRRLSAVLSAISDL